MEHFRCKAFVDKCCKKIFWVAYTFLQKPSFLKFFSILEENCGADIINGTIKCKFLLTNVSQNVFWVSYTFLQKLSSFKFYNNLEENCVVDINTEAIKCKTFVHKCFKELSLGKLYFPTKTKFLQVLQNFGRKLWCRHH